MIKSELIDIASKQLTQIAEKDIALAINQIIDEMGSTMQNGGRIEIRGFGSFSLHYRPPRRAHNPKTGEKLVTESKYAVHFKPGKDLRERVHSSSHLPIKQVDAKDKREDD